MATELVSTIKIKPDTRERIEAVKVHPRETIDDVIRRLLDAQPPQKGGERPEVPAS